MTILRCQVSFPSFAGGVGFDGYVNTWHAVVTSTPVAAATDFKADLLTFYTSFNSSQPNALIDFANGRFKAYNLSDPEPRAPIYDVAFNPGTGSATAPLPPECAICVSFQGDKVSGTPQARRRGRVYLGPWHTTANTTAGRILPATQTVLHDAAAALKTNATGSTDYSWVVYSRVAGSTTVVTNGWVDNDWDIQRRRSNNPTTRSTF